MMLQVITPRNHLKPVSPLSLILAILIKFQKSWLKIWLYVKSCARTELSGREWHQTGIKNMIEKC